MIGFYRNKPKHLVYRSIIFEPEEEIPNEKHDVPLIVALRQLGLYFLG